MQRYFLLSISILFIVNSGWAQKKSLDHSVYDGWQRASERVVSADGKWAAFTVDPQEGDGKLIARSLHSAAQIEFERGFGEDREPLCCNAAMTRQWGSFGVQFKGNGFYSTDNRK